MPTPADQFPHWENGVLVEPQPPLPIPDEYLPAALGAAVLIAALVAIDSRGRGFGHPLGVFGVTLVCLWLVIPYLICRGKRES